MRWVAAEVLRPEKLMSTVNTPSSPDTAGNRDGTPTGGDADIEDADADRAPESSPSPPPSTTPEAAPEPELEVVLAAGDVPLPMAAIWDMSTVLPQPEGPPRNTDRPMARSRLASSVKRAVSMVGTTWWSKKETSKGSTLKRQPRTTS